MPGKLWKVLQGFVAGSPNRIIYCCACCPWLFIDCLCCDACRPPRGDRGDRPPRRFGDGPPGGGGYRESRFGSREGGGGFGRGGGDKVSLPGNCPANEQLKMGQEGMRDSGPGRDWIKQCLWRRAQSVSRHPLHASCSLLNRLTCSQQSVLRVVCHWLPADSLSCTKLISGHYTHWQ